MKNILILILINLISSLDCFPQTSLCWDWNDSNQIIYRDAEYYDGYVYTIGNFAAPSVTLGANVFIKSGIQDFVVAKYDTLGNVIWANHYGGNSESFSNNLAVDSQGNVFVTGHFKSQMNTGINVLNAIDSFDLFFIKVSSNGITQMAKSVGTPRNEYGADITTDLNGGIYVLATVDSLQFAGKICRKSAAVLKFDSLGNEIFLHYITGVSNSANPYWPCCPNSTCDYAPMPIDAVGIKYSSIDSTIVLTGNYVNYIKTDSVFTNGNGICNGMLITVGAGYSSIFFAKITINGKWKYLNCIPGEIYKSASTTDLAIDESGNIYLTKNWCCSLGSGTGTASLLKIPFIGSFNPYNPLQEFYLKRIHKISYQNNEIFGILSLHPTAIGNPNINIDWGCRRKWAFKYNLNSGTVDINGFDGIEFYYNSRIAVAGANEKWYLSNENGFGKGSKNCALKVNNAPDVTFCPNTNPISIGNDTCHYVEGGNPNYIYSWQPITGLSNPNISNPTITSISASTSYTVTITDQIGNFVKDTILVTLDTLQPLVIYTIPANATVCQGQSITLNATGATTVNWTGNIINNVPFTPNNTITYIVYYSTNGCISQTTQSVTVIPTTYSPIQTQTACYTFNFNNQTLTQSGTYYDTLTNANGCDSIITLNLTINNASTSTQNQAVCYSFYFNNQTIAQSGIYYDTLINSTGCDSIITLNLTINNPTINTLNQTSCNSYYFNNQTLTTSGIYFDTLINSTGCDSIIALNLTINNPNSNTINQTTCNSYTFNNQTLTQSGIYYDTLTNSNGCDSLITLNLTIHNPSSNTLNQSACNAYFFNNQTLTQSGMYYDTLTNSTGCDSIITLNLTINHVNNAATQNGTQLSAIATGATYQWLTCNPFTIIAGATNQTYTATANGDYAVILTQNGCTDTSICMKVNGVGIDELNCQNLITISPNPTHSIFKIDCPLKGAKVILYNLFGQKLLTSTIENNSTAFNISQFSKGIYIVEIVDDKTIYRVKITKD